MSPDDMTIVPEEVPPGFRAIAFAGETFNGLVGPLYLRSDPDDGVVMGFRIEQRHCNPAGVVHGGMLMTFADMCGGFITGYKARIDKFLPTVNMTSDFVAPGRLGQWVEGRCEVIKTTRSLAFCHVMVTTRTGPLLRASAILKIPSGEGLRFDRAKLVDA